MTYPMQEQHDTLARARLNRFMDLPFRLRSNMTSQALPHAKRHVFSEDSQRRDANRPLQSPLSRAIRQDQAA